MISRHNLHAAQWLRVLLLCIATPAILLAQESQFRRITIDSASVSESCSLGDINGDGLLDIIAGTTCYIAPDWTPRKMFDLPIIKEYLATFGNFALDVDGDGDQDVITGGYHNKKLAWYENPGKDTGEWKEHIIDDRFPVEYVHMVDLDDDGRADDLLPNYGGGTKGIYWYDLNPDAPSGQRWTMYQLSETGNAHGNGAGDVNGDGRTDVLTPTGWLEAPVDRRNGSWKWHNDWDTNGRVAQMWTDDVDGDGDADILFSHGHTYDGIFWMEQRWADGTRQFIQHRIDNSWSQAHTLVLADMDGDGDNDLITGKRYYAHNGKDPGAEDPLVIYWYELRNDDGNVEYVRHTIDRGQNGVGHQLAVHDFDNDGDLDIFVGGKKGVYLYENMAQ